MRNLALPADPATLSELTAGEEVLLTGPVLTARDATHARILETLDGESDQSRNELLTLLEGQLIFYAGPTPARAGQVVGSVGPTTASRMDSAAARLMSYGVVATLGKGSRGADYTTAARRHGAVYFGAVGGAAALLAQHVTAAQTLLWPELGTEALVRMQLADFPAFVAIDSRGTNIYEQAVNGQTPSKQVPAHV